MRVILGAASAGAECGEGLAKYYEKLPSRVGPSMTALWLRVRIWYANRLLDIAEWLEAQKR